MAYLTSCRICGFSILDAEYCRDCEKEILLRVKFNPLEQREIKEKVEKERFERDQREAKKRLEELTKCPCCGKKK